MIYSVWNWNTGQYDYFRGDGAAPGVKVNGRKARGSGVGGVRLEDALPLLPRDAVLIGSGTDARGRIAIEAARAVTSANTGAGASNETHFQGFGTDPATLVAPTFGQQHPWLMLGLVVGGAWAAYRLLVSTSKALW